MANGCGSVVGGPQTVTKRYLEGQEHSAIDRNRSLGSGRTIPDCQGTMGKLAGGQAIEVEAVSAAGGVGYVAFPCDLR